MKSDCWCEFSLPSPVVKRIQTVTDKLQNKLGITESKANSYHVTLLYGYNENESKSLINICKKYLDEPLLLKIGEIRRGNISPVVLVDLQLSDNLNKLFWELYENIGQKKHSLIEGKYKPHITLVWSNNEDLDKLDLEEFKNELQGITFYVEELLSMTEDESGNNVIMDRLVFKDF